MPSSMWRSFLAMLQTNITLACCIRECRPSAQRRTVKTPSFSMIPCQWFHKTGLIVVVRRVSVACDSSLTPPKHGSSSFLNISVRSPGYRAPGGDGEFVRFRSHWRCSPMLRQEPIPAVRPISPAPTQLAWKLDGTPATSRSMTDTEEIDLPVINPMHVVGPKQKRICMASVDSGLRAVDCEWAKIETGFDWHSVPNRPGGKAVSNCRRITVIALGPTEVPERPSP